MKATTESYILIVHLIEALLVTQLSSETSGIITEYSVYDGPRSCHHQPPSAHRLCSPIDRQSHPRWLFPFCSTFGNYWRMEIVLLCLGQSEWRMNDSWGSK